MSFLLSKSLAMVFIRSLSLMMLHMIILTRSSYFNLFICEWVDSGYVLCLKGKSGKKYCLKEMGQIGSLTMILSISTHQGIDDKVIIEIFLEGGREFTAIVLDVGSDFDCKPVVFLPTEVTNN